MSHYSHLGVPPWASTEEVAAAYERLRAYLSEEREVLGEGGALILAETRAVDEAFAVLSDVERRVDYDQSIRSFCTRCYRGQQDGSSTCVLCGGAVAAPRGDRSEGPGEQGHADAGNGGAASSGNGGAPTALTSRDPVRRLALVAWLVGLAVVGMTAVLVLQALAGTGSDSGGDEPAATTEGARLAAWAPEVRPLVGFVERTRGLPFREAVEIELLSPERFQEALRETRDALSAQEQDALAAESGVLRALGLHSGHYDVLAHYEDPNLAVLGMYDFEEKVIRIGAEELDLFAEVTVVHELAHALQDQYFDLGRIADMPSAAAASAFRAVFEGDATRVESVYVETLNREEYGRYAQRALAHRDAVLAGRQAGGLAGGEDGDRSDEAPAVYAAYAAAPYELGAIFTEFLAVTGGEPAVDAALRDPPNGEQHILDPWTYLDGHTSRRLEAPALPAGARRIDDGELGALTWYLLLAERVDPRHALLALDGWGGDSFVTYEASDGRVCIEARFQGRTNADNAEMLAGLEAWVGAMPAGAASVTSRDTTIDFSSCDPGAGAVQSTGRSVAALVLPVVRTSVSTQLLAAGAGRGEARCGGRLIVEQFDLDEIEAWATAMAVGDHGTARRMAERAGELLQTCSGSD